MGPALARVTLSGCICVCVCVCDRQKAESNKLAEMVPSELHDWSIEFHHRDWPVGLNGSLWVTRLKHHTGFISPRLVCHQRPGPYTLTAPCICIYVCVWLEERKRDYDQEVCLWKTGWKRFCVLKRYGKSLWVTQHCVRMKVFLSAARYLSYNLRFTANLWRDA